MTDTEKAIEYLTPIAKSASKKMQYGKMLSIAIEALEEKQQRDNIKCENCRYADILSNEYPCSQCRGCFVNKFKPLD